MTKARWLLAGIFWVFVSTQACAPTAPREEKEFELQNLRLAVSLTEEAKQYYRQGKYAEAEPLYQRSLAIRKKALGSEHPDVGQSLNNLAELYRAQAKYIEAEPLYKRSLAI